MKTNLCNSGEFFPNLLTFLTVRYYVFIKVVLKHDIADVKHACVI